MKSKLTVTVDADLIPAAKRFARSQGDADAREFVLDPMRYVDVASASVDAI